MGYVPPSEADLRYVLKRGDTVTGDLILPGNTQNPLGAITKQYVDNISLTPGPPGPPGASNAVYSGIWTWTTKTTDAATSGQIGNNVSSGWTATQLNINQQKTDNTDVTIRLSGIKSGDNISVQQKTDSTKWALYQVTGAGTDQGSWWSFPVTTLDHGTATPNNSTDCLVSLEVTGDPPYVSKSGDTMSGDLKLDRTVNSASTLELQSGALPRWRIEKNNSSEGGSNSGADLEIKAYNDVGGYLRTPLSISRASGEVSVGGNPTSNLGVATKQYVDNAGPQGGAVGTFSSTSITTGTAPTLNIAHSYLNGVSRSTNTLTITKSGWWAIAGRCGLSGNISTGINYMGLVVNGFEFRIPITTTQTLAMVNATVKCSASEQITFVLRQDSGGTLSVTAGQWYMKYLGNE